MLVGDDGAGLPAGFDPAAAGLGLQIVQALVRELRGTISWSPAPGRRHAVTLELHPRPLGPPDRVRRVGAGPTGSSEAPTGWSGPHWFVVVCGSVMRSQPARRARALRRLSARRSSSDNPPQTPAS